MHILKAIHSRNAVKFKHVTYSFFVRTLVCSEASVFPQNVENPDAGYCACCYVSLKNANKSMLIAHKNTVKHKKSFEAAKSSIKLACFLVKKTTTMDEKVAKAELLITARVL